MRTRLSHSLPYAQGAAVVNPETYPYDASRGPPQVIGSLGTGVVLSLAAGLAGRALRLLTWGGAAAAVVVGTLVFGFGGWRGGGLLALFFASSSLLTRVHAARKPHPEHTAGRNGMQVIANGAVATALTVANGVWPAPWIWTAFAGAIAASTADTWATEIGLLSKTPPRLITARLRRTDSVVPPGTSGGVTWLGTIGACAGTAVIAASSAVWLDTRFAPVWLAGFLGMTLDSILGATVEGRVRGMTNDTVNLLASSAGAILASVLSRP